MNGKTNFTANFWQLAKEFQFKFPTMHKAIAVCDADAESPAALEALLQQRARERLRDLPFPLLFHVIKWNSKRGS